MTQSAIDRLPTEKTFGKAFDYTQWDGKTSYARLVRYPFSSDYREFPWLTSTNAFNEYLDTLPNMEVTGLSQLKYGQPVKIDIDFNEVLKYNYLVVWNPAQPHEGGTARYLYYFINDVIHVTTDTTKLVLQLDAVQTFLREVKFGQVYAEQGHAAIAESTITAGSQGILTQPEGMNLGADYVVAERKTVSLALAGNYASFSVMVVANTDLEASAGTKDDPNLDTARGSTFEGLPNGSSVYFFEDPDKFQEYVESMKGSPWMMQGIISVTAVPIVYASQSWPTVTLNGHTVKKPNATSAMETRIHKMWPGFHTDILNLFPAKFRHLKKFGVYPYSMLELSTYTGESLVLKPELWRNPDGAVVIRMHLAQPSPRIGIRPYNYNANIDLATPTADNTVDEFDRGEVWNVATWLANFPQFTIVNNGYLQVMASQAHSLQQSYRDASWTQSKALTGNNLAYDQSTSGMNLANDLTQNTVNHMSNQSVLQNQSAAMQAGIGAAAGIVGGASRGGLVGAGLGAASALPGIASAAVSINQNAQASAMQQRFTSAQNANQVGNQGYVRDTNKNYADYAAKGDYSNQIASINAKVEDAKLTQPSASGTVGGDAFMLVTAGWAVNMKLKTIPAAAIQVQGDYWLRYGYTINRFMKMPANFKCMSIFTYWKVKETYITSAQCPEPIKQALRGIFEKGVTVWHDPTKIGENGARFANTPIMANYINDED